MENFKQMEKPAKSEKRQEDGKFKPGESGNPDGPQKDYKKLKTKLVEQKLEELECDPIEAMVSLLKDNETPIHVKAKLASDLACFVYPKRKAVEHSGSIGKNNVNEMSEEELLAIANGDDN